MEVDYAAVIEEEAATVTDQDQEMITIDGVPLRKQYIDCITLGRESLSELQPIFQIVFSACY